MGERLADLGLLGGPGFGGEAVGASVCLGGQALEDIRQVGGGINAFSVRVADEGVERGGSRSGLCIAHEQPILLPDGTGADGVLDEVVVDLGAPISQVSGELVPLVERVADRSSGEAGGAVGVPGLELGEAGFDLLQDRGALLLALGADFFWRGCAVSQSGFDAVELLHLGEHPLRIYTFGFGFKKFPPRMGHAPDESDAAAPLGLLDEGVVGAVTIALDDAAEVGGHDVIQARGSTPGAPDKEADFSHGVVDHPQVAGPAYALALGILILHGCFVDHDIAIGEDFSLDGFDDQPTRIMGHAGPAAQRLT